MTFSIFIRSRTIKETLSFVAGLAALLGTCTANAQQIPPLEKGTATVRSKLVNGNQLEIRDAATNAPILLPKGTRLVEFLDPAVEVAIRLQSQPTGADIIFNFHNTADTPKGLGMLDTGILTLGQNVIYQDLRETNEAVTANVKTYVGKAYPYPSDLYCPAWVISNSTYHVGVSLQYPIMEYKHDAFIGLSNPKGAQLLGEGGAGWAVNFVLSTIGPHSWQKVQYSAELKPDERRQYVMSIRIQPKAKEWVRTLLPYRNYFRANYGGVKYLRDPKPVMAFGLSGEVQLSDDNPFGFAPQYRPDRQGFNKLAGELKTNYPGWGSVMIWLPGGVYRVHQENNFPFQFTSTWMNWPIASSSAFDDTFGLASIKNTGKDFGLWWGNSARMALTWDPKHFVDFDPDNPKHVKLALTELDIAAKAGATSIGLDTFAHNYTPIWKGYPWLVAMRLRYPYMRFVTEPSACDIMHTIAPTFISAWNDETKPANEEGLYRIKHPNYIADFLLPGHEIWAGFRYNGLTKYFGKKPDAARVLADVIRFSSYGYVALNMEGINTTTTTVNASKTWNTTVPADIRLSDAPEAFGPAAAGSTHVALGPSARADRVSGWRPPKTGTLSSPEAANPSRTAPSVTIQHGRADNRVVVVRPAIRPPKAIAIRPRPAANPASVRINPPPRSIAEAIKNAREALFGPPKPPKTEPNDPSFVEAPTDPR